MAWSRQPPTAVDDVPEPMSEAVAELFAESAGTPAAHDRRVTIERPPAVRLGGPTQIVSPLTLDPKPELEPAPAWRSPTAAAGPPPLLDLTVDPGLATGRGGRYSAVVANGSAHAVQARVGVQLANRRLRALVVPSQLIVGAGERTGIELLLRPRRPQLLRRERQHDALLVILDGGGTIAARRRLIFVQQRSRLAWLLPLLVVLSAAAVAALALLVPRMTTVPPVEGAVDVASAERALRAEGLRLDPRLRSRTTAAQPPGSILDQIPAAGVRLRRGERVTLLVAVAARRVLTPALEGQTPARATASLRAADLVAGPVLPEPAPPAPVVASQLPAAGTRVPAGTAVTTILRAARPGEAEPAGTAAAPAPVASSAGSTVAVPPIEGRGITDYARAVAAAGLAPRVIRTVHRAPIGTLIGVRPRPGAPSAAGERVRLLVSAGVPGLAFDTGAVLRIFDPRSGRTVRQASPPQGAAVEPSWSPEGRRLLYRVGRRLLLVSARLGDRGRVVHDGAVKYAAATFAPAPADGVIALVRRTRNDGDLCFARVGDGRLRPRCAADRRWDLGRQISWRAGGRELLVFGVRRGQRDRFGILRYRSERPYSTNPADWRGELATDASAPGRGAIAAAYAPDGSRVALVTNRGLPRFQLLVSGAGDLRDPAARPLPVRACEVGWRPDGRELAVVQSDDDCARPVGEVVRVNPARPRAGVTVSSGGRHPAYQPLTYAGPKGVS